MKFQSIWHFRYKLVFSLNSGLRSGYSTVLSFGKHQALPYGGVTIFAIPNPHSNTIVWAFQRCHPSDQFNRKEALRRVAEKTRLNPVITKNHEFDVVKKHIDTLARLKTAHFTSSVLDAIFEGGTPSPSHPILHPDMFIYP